MNEFFDITKENGEWMCSNDRPLYHIHTENKGQVGYTAGKTVSSKNIHTSKRRKVTLKRTSTTVTTSTSESETESETQSE